MYEYYNNNNGNQEPVPGGMSFDLEPPKKRNGRAVIATILASVFIVSVVAFGSLTVHDLILKGALGSGESTSQTEDDTSDLQADADADSESTQLELVSRPADDSTQISGDGPYTVEQVATLVQPSVIGIEIRQNAGIQGMQTLGQGSGIIMTEDGYILTNAHVVADGNQIIVTLNDGTEYEAKVVGSDSKTDLAVLKVEATGLPAAEFGDSTQATVGEDVVAIGNAAGLGNTVTNGIISALERDVYEESGYALKCIQTNAAINPGNSGGALINMYGQVIGINSAKLVSTDYEGLGFAIPISEAQPIINQLIEYGYVKGRARIGISYDLISELTARMYDVQPGLYVMDIDKDAPVGQSGLEVYDIITQINGQDTLDTDAVSEILKGLKPGDTITATVFRPNMNSSGGTSMQITITLDEDTGTES